MFITVMMGILLLIALFVVIMYLLVKARTKTHRKVDARQATRF
jgi:uncharacterized membrane protein